MTMRSPRMSFQRKRQSFPNPHGGEHDQRHDRLRRLRQLVDQSLDRGKRSSTVGFVAFFLGSLTPIAGFRSILPHVTACAKAARSAACMFLIVYGDSEPMNELKNAWSSMVSNSSSRLLPSCGIRYFSKK